MRLAAFLILLAACGDDPPQNKPTAPSAPGAPAAPGTPGAAPSAGSGKPLPTMRHAEDRVNCPTPRSGSKRCDPNATKPVVIGVSGVSGVSGSGSQEKKAEDLTCGENEVCLNTTEGFLCGPCSERFAIRHDFKDRDFADETNRDPFQSFVIKVPGSGSGSGDLPTDPGSKCVRSEQLRVTNYGYQDLKLVGIVSQGTQRKVLMMDPGNYGHIIKRGDCVGKEKAWVKDIGENFICFEMSTEAAASVRPDGQCVELHNKQLTVTQLPQAGGGPTVAPVLPSTTNPVPVTPAGPTTTIIPGRQTQQQVPPVAQPEPPLNLRP